MGIEETISEEVKKQSIERGIEKGIEQGVINLLKNGKLSIEEIAEIYEVSVSFVLNVNRKY